MGRDTSFFTTIKEKVDLEDYLAEHLNVELVPDGPGRMSAVCPFHEEDTPSFKVMDSDDGAWKRWWCFGSCQEGGSVIDATMKAEGYELAHEAAQYLNDLYDLGLELDSAAYKAFAKTVRETTSDIEKTRSEIEGKSKVAGLARNYLHRRGFTDEIIDHFQLGVDVSQTKAGRLSIPLIDKANHPVSIANRALFDDSPCRACGERVTVKEIVKAQHISKKALAKENKVVEWKVCPHCGAKDSDAKVSWLIGQNPKYRFVRDFDKANFMYHENESRRALIKDESTLGLIMVEGYADVWASYQSGHIAVCSYNGAVLSDWQANEAVKELARPAGKPVILVPDFDLTGQKNIDPNIRKLRAVDPEVEVQVVYGVDELAYMDGLEEKRCKDLGDVLKHHGAEKVHEILRDNRWPAAEWMIRQLVERKNSKTGEPHHSQQRQMQLVAEVLSHEKSKIALDQLVVYLSEAWEKDHDVVRDWFYSNLSSENVSSYPHLFKDIDQARVEAREFLQDDNVIPIGFKEIDSCLPGGGVRPGQLGMALGKSGTGKAQPLEAKVLTPRGWSEIGEIVPGDAVLDPEGEVVNVTDVFPQGDRVIYRVTLNDGAATECDIEHLWRVRPPGGSWQVLTLAEILDRFDLASEQVALPGVSVALADAQGAPAAAVDERWITDVSAVGVKPAVCIALDSESQLYVTDDFIVTHNTMLASQILTNMADIGVRSIFFSLEQAAKSLYTRLVCQSLDIATDEAEALIMRDDEEATKELEPVRKIYERMLIIDNVPEGGKDSTAI